MNIIHSAAGTIISCPEFVGPTFILANSSYLYYYVNEQGLEIEECV